MLLGKEGGRLKYKWVDLMGVGQAVYWKQSPSCGEVSLQLKSHRLQHLRAIHAESSVFIPISNNQLVTL